MPEGGFSGASSDMGGGGGGVLMNRGMVSSLTLLTASFTGALCI